MPVWSLPYNANGRVRRPDCAPAASVVTPVRIEGIAGTAVLAIRTWIELSTVAGLIDHLLRQHRCCGDACKNVRRKELEGRHWLCSFRCVKDSHRAVELHLTDSPSRVLAFCSSRNLTARLRRACR